LRRAAKSRAGSVFSALVQFHGYEFRNPDWLALAFTHASKHEARDNERLEFLGDATLDLIVADELFRRSPELSEGQMTEVKALIVSRPSLGRVARELGLEHHARVGAGLGGDSLPVSVLANLYEAALGAVYVDGGLEAARAVALSTLRATIDRAAAEYDSSHPKQRLQHIAQSRWGGLPNYELVESRGSAHARAFQMRARIGETLFPTAWGRTRKEAERWAAFEALLVLDDAAAASQRENKSE